MTVALTPIASVTKLRSNLKEYIADLGNSGTIVVLKHSEPVAALLPYSEFKEYVDFLEDREDTKIGLERAQEFRDNPDNFLDAEDVFKE